VKTLTQRALERAVRVLARRDADLGMILRTYGVPPLWPRDPGFATLVHLVLEQQVSLASARAAFERLRAALPALDPAGFLEFSDARLRVIGFSRQKALYCRELARAMLDGRLDVPALEQLDDRSVLETLTALKGIGSWTANLYLLMALRRPDAFPASDLALLIAAHRIKKMRRRPTPERLERIAESWRPYRSVAARLLWHYYLSQRRPPSATT
jgi:DNA-3-methyladenine glycosylase II